jgi:hypothetical protein
MNSKAKFGVGVSIVVAMFAARSPVAAQPGGFRIKTIGPLPPRTEEGCFVNFERSCFGAHRGGGDCTSGSNAVPCTNILVGVDATHLDFRPAEVGQTLPLDIPCGPSVAIRVLVFECIDGICNPLGIRTRTCQGRCVTGQDCGARPNSPAP